MGYFQTFPSFLILEMSGLLRENNSQGEELKVKSHEHLKADNKNHSPSNSVKSLPMQPAQTIPPVKFDGKVDLRRIFSLIEYKGLRFLILDCPTDNTLPLIIAEFKKYNVTDVVRVCEPTYSVKSLFDANITVHDIPYLDGGTPPPTVVTKFLNLVQSRYGDTFPAKKSSLSASASAEMISQQQKSSQNRDSLPLLNNSIPTIAVHCVAGKFYI